MKGNSWFWTLVLLMLFDAGECWAHRQWEKVHVPDAYCGDGSPYSIYVDRRDSSKIAVYFKGGGACWNSMTCFGPARLTNLHDTKVNDFGGFISDNPAESPVADYTMVYLPYCTGDAFAGKHVAKYRRGTVRHIGRLNVERTFEYLPQIGVSMNTATDIVVYGYSAGAIGALVNLDTVDRFLGAASNKTMLADAPGLHFGKRFWNKFSSALRRDFEEVIDGGPLNGNTAYFVPYLCQEHRDWKLGVLQGSRDIVMSAIFGNAMPWAEEKSIFGPNGLHTITRDPTDNCSAWVPRTPMHTFLYIGPSAKISVSGVNALEFARDTILGIGGRNYP